MTWSLKLRSGDIALDGTSLSQVTGANKLVQDLRCAIMERQGTDDLHPDFGSLIDGGRDSNGNLAQSVIGGSEWPYMAMIVKSEILRIAGDLQLRQIDRAQQDKVIYGKATQTPGEVLQKVGDITLTQVQDTLVVSVPLTTGSGDQIFLNLPVTTDSVMTPTI